MGEFPYAICALIEEKPGSGDQMGWENLFPMATRNAIVKVVLQPSPLGSILHLCYSICISGHPTQDLSSEWTLLLRVPGPRVGPATLGICILVTFNPGPRQANPLPSALSPP